MLVFLAAFLMIAKNGVGETGQHLCNGILLSCAEALGAERRHNVDDEP